MEGRALEKRAEEGRDPDDGTTANKTAITQASSKSKSRRMASAAAGEKEKEEEKEEEDKVLRRALLFSHSQSVGRAGEDIR